MECKRDEKESDGLELFREIHLSLPKPHLLAVPELFQSASFLDGCTPSIEISLASIFLYCPVHASKLDSSAFLLVCLLHLIVSKSFYFVLILYPETQATFSSCPLIITFCAKLCTHLVLTT